MTCTTRQNPKSMLTGYVSMNPLTILARVLRGKELTVEQAAVYATYPYTDAERANVAASLV